MRAQAQERMAADEKRLGPELFDKIETLYQIGNRNFGQPEAQKPLEEVLAKYPQSDRAGSPACTWDNWAAGAAAKGYYRQAIAKYDDCFWGDGTQVGPAARYLLAGILHQEGQTAEAERLEKEITTRYPEAVWHDGRPLAKIVGK